MEGNGSTRGILRVSDKTCCIIHSYHSISFSSLTNLYASGVLVLYLPHVVLSVVVVLSSRQTVHFSVYTYDTSTSLSKLETFLYFVNVRTTLLAFQPVFITPHLLSQHPSLNTR